MDDWDDQNMSTARGTNHPSLYAEPLAHPARALKADEEMAGGAQRKYNRLFAEYMATRRGSQEAREALYRLLECPTC